MDSQSYYFLAVLSIETELEVLLLDLSPVENGKACAAHLLHTAIFFTQSTSLMRFTITVKMEMHVSIEAQKQWLSELELYQINYKYFPETKVFPLYVEDYKLEKFNEIKKDGNSK